MCEIFKDIKNYEDLYEISNLGRIRNKITGKILKPSIKNGYYYLILCKDKIQKHHYIHRLVASTFIPNPNNYSQVNHIDENKLNNNVDTLEWCTSKYNTNYSVHKRSNPVNQFSLDGRLLNTYKSTQEASRQTGISQGNIVQCCLGNPKYSHAGNFIWKYVN